MALHIGLKSKNINQSINYKNKQNKFTSSYLISPLSICSQMEATTPRHKTMCTHATYIFRNGQTEVGTPLCG